MEKRKCFKLSSSQKILLGMVVGVVIGIFYPAFAVTLEPLSTIFIHLVKTIVVPIIVASLIVGIAGLPLSAVAVLLSVDAIADMGRTTVNVVGNCLASAVVAKWEGLSLEPITIEEVC